MFAVELVDRNDDVGRDIRTNIIAHNLVEVCFAPDELCDLAVARAEVNESATRKILEVGDDLLRDDLRAVEKFFLEDIKERLLPDEDHFEQFVVNLIFGRRKIIAVPNHCDDVFGKTSCGRGI